jgi:CheY-like chemotaxis protein
LIHLQISISIISNFKPNLYDLAILDIKMPNISGFQLYREIKKMDSKLKVCFLTASEMYYEEYRKEEEEDAAALDKDLFILKPISNQGLLQEVNKIMMSY